MKKGLGDTELKNPHSRSGVSLVDERAFQTPPSAYSSDTRLLVSTLGANWKLASPSPCGQGL